MRTNFKIAYRFLKSNKGQTVLIALGIGIGVAVQIFLGLLINNLNNDLVNRTVGGSSQITVTSKDKADKMFSDYTSIVNNIKDKEQNKVKQVLNVLEFPALVKKGEVNESILVRGIDYSNENDIYDIKNKIIEGKYPDGENETLLGKGLMDKLSLKVGDEFSFIAPDKKEKIFKVSGVVDYKIATLNDLWVLTNLNSVQKLLDKQGKVTSIEMTLEKNWIFKSDEVATSIVKDLPNNLKVDNWKAQNAQLLNALSGQNSSSLTIQVFIIVSVIMGIAGVLAISVMQKSKQIGILKAMGIKNRSAASIFILQGVMLGTLGAVIGSSLGVALFKVFNSLVRNQDGTPIVSGVLSPSFIGLSIVLAIVASVLAAVAAARKSLKLDPIEVIRNS